MPFGTDAEAFWEVVFGTAQWMPDGPRTYIYCGAGIGRTGRFAVAVLCRIGYAAENALAEIRAAASFTSMEAAAIFRLAKHRTTNGTSMTARPVSLSCVPRDYT